MQGQSLENVSRDNKGIFMQSPCQMAARPHSLVLACVRAAFVFLKRTWSDAQRLSGRRMGGLTLPDRK